MAPDENQVRYLVEMWCRVARTTHERRLAPGVGAELRAFAFQDLPRLLGRFQYRDGQNAVSTVAETLGHVASPIDAVEFLVVRAETEPRWLRLLHQDYGWHVTRIFDTSPGLVFPTGRQMTWMYRADGLPATFAEHAKDVVRLLDALGLALRADKPASGVKRARRMVCRRPLRTGCTTVGALKRCKNFGKLVNHDPLVVRPFG